MCTDFFERKCSLIKITVFLCILFTKKLHLNAYYNIINLKNNFLRANISLHMKIYSIPYFTLAYTMQIQQISFRKMTAASIIYKKIQDNCLYFSCDFHLSPAFLMIMDLRHFIQGKCVRFMSQPEEMRQLGKEKWNQFIVNEYSRKRKIE